MYIRLMTGGVSWAHVCTDATDIEAMLDQFNKERPSVTQNRWDVCPDPTFNDGKPNPFECENNPKTHKHFLLSC